MKEELDRIKQACVIVQQQEHIARVNTMVTVLNPSGKMRIYIDHSHSQITCPTQDH